MSEIAAPTTAAPPASSTPPAATAAEAQPSTTTNTVNAATAGEQGKTETPPTSKTTVAGLKDNKEQPAAAKPSVIEQVKRYIPGLGSKDEPTKSSKRKKSGKKTGTATSAGDVAHAKDPALATATLETAPSRDELPKELRAANGNGNARPRIAGLNGTPVEEEVDTKKFSAAAYVQKRLRTNNKKIQKLQSYQDQTSPLNEDQKKSLQQKPILEAIQRELGEISKAFETEEADEAKRAEKQKKSEEHRVQQKVAAAVSDEKLNNQNELALLLQFLHLYSLFNPGQATQYNQSAVPPVVANATALQHRAVHELFQNLANGPLVGTGDDAVSHIENLRSGSNKSVIEGVTFAEVKQMILDLTAGPAEMGHELPPSSEVPTSSEETAVPAALSTTGADHEGSIAAPASAAPAASGLNFMQASEIESGSAAQQPQSSLTAGVPLHPATSNEVGSNAATPGFGNTPSVEKTEAAAHNNWDGPAPSNKISPETLPKIVPSGWEEPTDPVKSWADDVDENSQANPFTATPDLPADTQEQQITTGPVVDADGFTQGSRGRGGRGRGEGRGGRGRGEGRGRGSGRGGRGGASGEWTRREPREGGASGEWTRREPREPRGEGEGGERRGSFRGRGRGEGRGRGGEFSRGGRGGDRGRPQSGNVPTIATTQEA